MILKGVIVIMKNKYQRMDKKEKKLLYKQYKEEKLDFTKKMERMLLFCKIGIIYSIIAIIYDFLLSKNIYMGIFDGILLLFCIYMFIRTNNIKIELLNKYALEKDKKIKKDILKKYQKDK